MVHNGSARETSRTVRRGPPGAKRPGAAGCLPGFTLAVALTVGLGTGGGLAAETGGPPPTSQTEGDSSSATNTVSLTLSDCLALALTNNPGLSARAAEVAQARAERQGAAGARWPSLHAVGNYTHATLPQILAMPTANGVPMVFARDLAGGNLVASLPLFTGGQLSARIQAAQLLKTAAGHRLARTREELIFNVSAAYFSQLGQQHIVESVAFSRDTLQAHRRRIQDLLAARKAVRVDLLRTEVRLADVAQQLVQEQNLLAIQQRLLATLLAEGAGGRPVRAADGLSTNLQTASPEGVFAFAKSHRADWLAAERETAAQRRTVVAARGAHWPQLSARASYGEQYAVNPTLLPGQFDDYHAGFVGVVADVPLFEGGQIAARVRREREKLAAAQARLRELELQVQLEVESAVLNVNSSRARAQATAQSQAQAQESLALERDKYDAGKGTIVDVLDAQSALLEAQTSYYRALADHQIAWAQLRLAKGEQP